MNRTILAVGALFATACLLMAGCPAPSDEAAPSAGAADTRPHGVFLVSEDPANYEAHRTIPKFAETLDREHGLRTTVLLGEGEQPSFRFPGLQEALAEADLLVVFFRRSALPVEQLDAIKDYIARGHPVVGIRTANHAFSLRTVADGHRPWWEFVSEVLGCENRGYGPDEAGTDVAAVAEAADHPILRGVEPAKWHSTGSLYLVDPLLDAEATVLLRGAADDRLEPIAWTRTADKSRVFYTSLGHPDDFDAPPFRRLLVNGILWALQEDERP